MYSICIIWVAFIPIYFGTTAASGTGKNPKNNYKVKYSSYKRFLFCILYKTFFLIKDTINNDGNVFKFKCHSHSILFVLAQATNRFAEAEQECERKVECGQVGL